MILDDLAYIWWKTPNFCSMTWEGPFLLLSWQNTLFWWRISGQQPKERLLTNILCKVKVPMKWQLQILFYVWWKRLWNEWFRMMWSTYDEKPLISAPWHGKYVFCFFLGKTLFWYRMSDFGMIWLIYDEKPLISSPWHGKCLLCCYPCKTLL